MEEKVVGAAEAEEVKVLLDIKFIKKLRYLSSGMRRGWMRGGVMSVELQSGRAGTGIWMWCRGLRLEEHSKCR